MRRAFVGLSTPICYDLENYADDLPNPILDSPFGLLLLFDEIWFLSRALCPGNMRKLPYVKFLDETEFLPPLPDLKLSDDSLARK